MCKRDRSEHYTRAFHEVRRVVNEHDPIGLLAGGAPVDEYESEVSDLVRLVMRAQPLSEEEVDAVWRRWFGDEYSLGDGAKRLSDALAELQRQLDRR